MVHGFDSFFLDKVLPSRSGTGHVVVEVDDSVFSVRQVSF